MKILFWVVVAFVVIVLVLFTVSNRATVTVGLWPLPQSLELPLYLALLAALLLGFIAGGVCVWFAGRSRRRVARERARRVVALERELAAAGGRDSGSPVAAH